MTLSIIYCTESNYRRQRLPCYAMAQTTRRRTSSRYLCFHRARIKGSSISFALIALIWIALVSCTMTIDASTVQTSPHIKTTTMPSSAPSSSLIICAVDGSIFTLDAFSGDLRGLFSSGTPLVGASDSPSLKNNNNDNDSNGDNDSYESFDTSWNDDNRDRIVPGLDGRLYAIRNLDPDGTPQLEPLPITVMDVLANPIKSCSSETDCGIVTGTKLTSLFALDPTTGVLQWTQSSDTDQPTFTKEKSSNEDSNNIKDERVVLQREDFIVKQVSVNTGQELWNVTVGRFNALDFARPSQQSPILERHTDTMMLPGYSEEEHILRDEEHDESNHQGGRSSLLPSVAFSDDGTILTAVDDETNVVLWRKQMEFSIAEVYGVGGEGQGWVSLRVLDEQQLSQGSDQETWATVTPLLSLPASDPQKEGKDSYIDFLLHRGMTLFSDPLLVTGGSELVPYKAPDVKAMLQDNIRFGQLGKQSTNKFAQLLPGRKMCTPLNQFCQQVPQIEGPFQIMKGDIPTIELPNHLNSVPLVNGGLFLTWPMVFGILGFLLGISFAVRIKYMKVKQKYLVSTPPLLPANTNSHENEGNGLVKIHRRLPTAEFLMGGESKQNDITLSTHSNLNVIELSISDNMSKGKISRSMSLPVFQIIENALDTPPPPLPPKTTATSMNIPDSQNISGGIVAIPNLPEGTQMIAGAGNVDGIPLVRYSRYSSEFNELSALGKGGFGTVFRCTNTLDGRGYAVKKVWIKSNTDANGNILTEEFSTRLHRVLREVKVLALLDHPNIVRYYTAWLELDEDIGHPESSTTNENSYTATMDFDCTNSKIAARCFSSELVMGSGNKGASKTSEASQHYDASRLPLQDRNGDNPLGWNNFDFFSTGGVFDSFRQSSSASLRSLNDEDCGITFERSGNFVSTEHAMTNTPRSSLSVIHDHDTTEGSSVNGHKSSSSSSISSTHDSESGFSTESLNEIPTRSVRPAGAPSTIERISAEDKTKKKQVTMISQSRHTLYIQMQLCSQKNLSDFLANPEARRGTLKTTNREAVDIPYALSLFNQIAQGVKHVHDQGLIHRDLKPQNCFIDDAGVVKVGDFGLSRESAVGSPDNLDNVLLDEADHSTSRNLGGNDDHTSGVGTRSYASPEQINGSDYDASTDVYSLGIILFELCYPMSTGMERHIVFDGLRRLQFPDSWCEKVVVSFPSFSSLQSLLAAMLDQKPTDRPSADAVAQRISSLLGEYTVLSLDRNRTEMKGTVYLRVEAIAEEGALPRTLKLIKDAAPEVNIVQYGMRGEDSKSILEFALSSGSDELMNTDSSDLLELIIQKMNESEDISLVRQVSNR